MKESTKRWIRQLAVVGGIFFIALALIQVHQVTYDKPAIMAGPQDGLHTIEVPPFSVIKVTVVGEKKMEVQLITVSKQDATLAEGGNLTHSHLAAGGSNGGGVGTNVDLAPYMSVVRTVFIIKILPPLGADYDEYSMQYTINYTLWMPDYTLIFLGIFFIFGFIVLDKLSYMALESRVKFDELSKAVTGRPFTQVSVVAAPQVAPQAVKEIPAQPKPVGTLPQALPPPPSQAGQLGQPGQLGQLGQLGQPGQPGQAGQPPVPPQAQPGPVAVAQTVGPTVGMKTAPPTPAMSAPPAKEPLTRIKCPGCKEIIPVYSAERPLKVSCPKCGKQGMLK